MAWPTLTGLFQGLPRTVEFSSASPHFGITGDTEQERIAGTARISEPRFLFLAQIARSVWPRLSSELAARDGCEGSRCPARIRRDFVDTAVREFDPHGGDALARGMLEFSD